MNGRSRAFTLIELMIAISLGTMLVYVTYAGFRVASQCVTAANRLSLENSIMRAGYVECHENLDFWLDCDNPDVVAKQPLRAVVAGKGLPFAPFKTTFPSANLSDSNQEKHRGWESGFSWRANDPATWWRASSAESYLTDVRFGFYSIFANTSAQFQLSTDPTYVPSVYGTISVAHTWLYNQYHDLNKALQFYGYADYMPANALYSIHMPYKQASLTWAPTNIDLDEGTSRAGVPLFFTQWASRFANADGAQQIVRGLWRLTQGTGYAFVRPDRSPAPTAAQLVEEDSHIYRIGYLADANSLRDFRSLTDVPTSLLSQRPEFWPDGKVSVVRYIRARRFINVCRIRWNNPVTGQVTSVAFTSTGTTLRGARQQRSQGGGWAYWDNGPSAVNDLTLDSP
jgi:prepilin-type N-terminal cleavage/methylation domain-containing protein